MKLPTLVIVTLLSFVTTVLTVKYVLPTNSAATTAEESAYDRVLRTGTLKCAYVFWPRLLEKNLQTGQYTGLYYDLVEEMGKQLNLKIDWAEEVGTSNAFEGLKTKRYDAVCMPFTPTPSRSRVTDFTVPILFFPYVVMVRPGETRFDRDLAAIDDPSVHIAVMDGELGQTIAHDDFSRAQTLSLPNLTDISQVLEQVADGKADVVMTEASTANDFLSKNPGRLKILDRPVRVIPGGMSVGINEIALKDMLNTTIEALYVSGLTKRLLNKYSDAPNLFLLPTSVAERKTTPSATPNPQQ